MVELEEFRYRVRDPLEDVFRRGETVIRILVASFASTALFR